MTLAINRQIWICCRLQCCILAKLMCPLGLHEPKEIQRAQRRKLPQISQRSHSILGCYPIGTIAISLSKIGWLNPTYRAYKRCNVVTVTDCNTIFCWASWHWHHPLYKKENRRGGVGPVGWDQFISDVWFIECILNNNDTHRPIMIVM